MTTSIDIDLNDLDGATHPDQLTRPLYGATFGQAVKRYIKGYINFNGRASRSEYWWAQLALFLFALPGGLIYGFGFGMVQNNLIEGPGSITGEPGPGLAIAFVGMAMLGIFSLAILLPSWALLWRRFHDAGFAGPLALLGLFPYLGGIYQLIMASMPSKPQGRRYDVL
ncbi:DUF805 domain-containing protein [Leucobacter sp. cx-169]|uniref:DUF805 domain-containing protein n=1 Tax=Leucobacter sp. cx-169 TaxID=2770549 RepID=UPI00165D618B|nr:DUF805 domain-containing protein [Leucobacter sp. cx-169]MBC9927372.1 DUF805 domain-containing protein [Leucobacter sp. cx-169]